METTKSLFVSAMKAGLIIGVISIVIFLFMYIAGIQPIGFMLPILILLLSIAISVAFLVIFLKKFRSEIGGFISFKDAFLYGLIALGLSVILYQFFNFVFIQLVEPEYYKTLMEAQKTWLENYLAGKVSEEQIATELGKIDAKTAEMGSFLTLIKNTVGSLIFMAVIALVVGAIMKKKPNLFDNNTGGVI